MAADVIDRKMNHLERKLFLLQRLSAVVLAPMVLIHLLLIFYAVKQGMTGEDILQRTAGSPLWAIFYLAFVVTVSIHAPIGLRNVLNEWTGLSKSITNKLMVALFVIFILLGLRSVIAVIAPGGW